MSNLATIVNNILADSGIDDINVVVTTGSYANPAWITSLAWTKITDTPSFVTGTGTTNYLPKFTSATTIGNSNITDSGSLIQLLSNTQLQGKLYYTYDWLQEKNFGYSSGWKTLAIGSLTSANNFSLAFGVDVSGNPSPSFTGNGNEYFWRNSGSFKTPNASNNGYNQLFEWNSSGGMTFNQAAEFIGTVTVGSPLSIKSTTPYIQWINASSVRLAYIQHNATNLVYNADTGVHVFNQSATVTDTFYVKSSVYPSAYFTSLRSDSSANGILQLGNNNDNYILGGNTAAGGYLIFRVNVTSESIASGVESLRLNSNATASFSSRVNVNGAADDADIALQTVAPSGAGKYIYVGRDSSAQWRFSVHSSGDTQIGAPQAGAVYKLLTLSSNGNNLDTGTVLRLIGNSALDLVDISVNDTTTRIYHQENAPDAANGYGKIQFRTNATANGSFPTRGGFQFTIGSTDALFINSTGAATFSSSVTAASLNTNRISSTTSNPLIWNTAGVSDWFLGSSPLGNSTSDLSLYSYGTSSVVLNIVRSTGAATFSSSVTVGTIAALTPSGFGYDPNSYRTLIVGPTGNSIFKTLTFGVDVSGNPSGAFSGSGSEYVWRNTASFITPNAINNGFTTLLGWNSSGQITFSQASLFASSLQVNSSFQIGDYTQGTNNLTFAASANGIAKINFYDSNNTEGLYIRTDGESQGGTMTFGARWDDDEAKIVFKMYQVSAGGPYNARVGIGTTAPSSTLHVIGNNGNSVDAVLRLRDTNATARTTRLQFEDYNGTLADGLIDFKIGTAGVASSATLSIGIGIAGLTFNNTNAATFSSTLQATNIGINNTPTLARLFANQTTDGEWIATFKNYGGSASYGVSIDMSGSTSNQSALQVYTRAGNGIRVTAIGNLLVGTFTDIGGNLVVKRPYSSGYSTAYIGNTSFTAWNRQVYDTFVLQQDDVTSFRMVEKNGEATGSDQVLTFSIGDNLGVIATSAQPLGFYVNGSPSGIAYQGLSGTQVLRLQTNGSANFYGALDVASTISTSGSIVSTVSGTSELRLRGGGYGGSYNTSLRSIAGASGVLQFGNNGTNYILAGNTAAGGFLYFKVNCNSESTSSGSLALTLNANATALFSSSVTATAFFESSDKRLKSNIINLDIDAGSIAAKHYTKNGVEEIGYLAQDVEAILPSAISKREDGYLDLSYRQVHTAKIAHLEKEIKELKEQLKNK